MSLQPTPTQVRLVVRAPLTGPLPAGSEPYVTVTRARAPSERLNVCTQTRRSKRHGTRSESQTLTPSQIHAAKAMRKEEENEEKKQAPGGRVRRTKGLRRGHMKQSITEGQGGGSIHYLSRVRIAGRGSEAGARKQGEGQREVGEARRRERRGLACGEGRRRDWAAGNCSVTECMYAKRGDNRIGLCARQEGVLDAKTPSPIPARWTTAEEKERGRRRSACNWW